MAQCKITKCIVINVGGNGERIGKERTGEIG